MVLAACRWCVDNASISKERSCHYVSYSKQKAAAIGMCKQPWREQRVIFWRKPATRQYGVAKTLAVVYEGLTRRKSDNGHGRSSVSPSETKKQMKIIESGVSGDLSAATIFVYSSQKIGSNL